MISTITVFEFKKGSEAAFKEVYNDLFPDMQLYLKRHNTPDHLIPEIISDVFMAMWKKRDEFVEYIHIKRTSLISVKNRYLTYIRDRHTKTHLELIDAVDVQEPEGDAEGDLERLIAYLPPVQKRLFTDRYIKLIPPRDIARDTGTTVQTVKNLLTLAKKRIRSLFLGEVIVTKTKKGRAVVRAPKKEKESIPIERRWKQKRGRPRKGEGSKVRQMYRRIYELRSDGYRYKEIDRMLGLMNSARTLRNFTKDRPTLKKKLVRLYKEAFVVSEATQKVVNLKNAGYSSDEINIELSIGTAHSRVRRYCQYTGESFDKSTLIKYKSIARQVAKIIVDNLDKPSPGVPEISRQVGASETRLKKAFKKVYGDSIHSYYVRKKMVLVKGMIEKGQITTAKDLAVRLGYKSPRRLNDAYKRANGESLVDTLKRTKRES